MIRPKNSGRSTWLTFAHELGHNFAGRHSFEEGQGKTGGIMDYGDGKKNGVYQFNTKYRKEQMCDKLNKVVGQCGSCKFEPQGGSCDPSKSRVSCGNHDAEEC